MIERGSLKEGRTKIRFRIRIPEWLPCSLIFVDKTIGLKAQVKYTLSAELVFAKEKKERFVFGIAELDKSTVCHEI